MNTMRPVLGLSLAGLLALAAMAPLPALAQGPAGAQVVTNCGSMNYAAGSIRLPTQTRTGRACGQGNALLTGAVTNPTSTLTLPSTTTAYSTKQLIANSATAGSVVNPSFTIANSGGSASIPALRLSTNDTTSTAWGAVTIQVDLWSAAPTWTNGDRGTWSPATGVAAHLGSYTCAMSAEYGDGAFAECSPSSQTFPPLIALAGQTIYWSLQAVTASGTTGASKAFVLTAELAN